MSPAPKDSLTCGRKVNKFKDVFVLIRESGGIRQTHWI